MATDPGTTPTTGWTSTSTTPTSATGPGRRVRHHPGGGGLLPHPPRGTPYPDRLPQPSRRARRAPVGALQRGHDRLGGVHSPGFPYHEQHGPSLRQARPDCFDGCPRGWSLDRHPLRRHHVVIECSGGPRLRLRRTPGDQRADLWVVLHRPRHSTV